MTSALLERARTVGQFVVADLDIPTLNPADRHHLATVLRARRGERVALTDGGGAWRVATWSGDDLVELTPVREEARSDVEIVVGFALLKGDKTEWVVQKLTEIGVDVIVPLKTERTIVRWDDEKAVRNFERLQKVAHEAAMQSRRVWLPRLQALTPVVTAFERGMAAAHPGGEPVSLRAPSVAVGPEGGFSDEELARAQKIIDLGPTILRAETAATTVGVLLGAVRSNTGVFAPCVP